MPVCKYKKDKPVVYNRAMNVRIEIDTKTFVRFWLVVIGFIAAALALYSARTALLIIGISVFFAITLSMPVNRIIKLLPSKSRVLSTAIAYVLVVLALGTFVLLAVPPMVQQTAKLAQTVPSLVDSATEQYSGVDKFVAKYKLEKQYDEVVLSVKNSAVSFAKNLGTNVIGGIGSILLIITSSIVVFVLTFLMLVEGPVWLGLFWSVFKNKKQMESTKKVFVKMYNVVTSYVSGQLVVSSIAGSVAGILVLVFSMLFDIPINLMVPATAVVFVFSLIPIFGSSIGAVIVASLLALNDIKAALIFLGLFVIYQQIEGNIISPKIQSKKIDLSALAILIAVTIGIYVFGMAGAIVSIPIAGCIKVVLDDYFSKAKELREEKSSSTLSKLINNIQTKK